jgi:hypothetical protein
MSRALHPLLGRWASAVALVVVVAACTGSDPVVEQPPATSATSVPAPAPDRAPDGAALVVVAREPAEITVVDPDTGAETVLSDPEGEVIARQPVWSRDGRFVAWASVGDDGGAAVRWRSPATGVSGAAPTRSIPFFLAYGPRSDGLAWLGNVEGGVGLSLVDTAGERSADADAGVPYFVDWRPDGGLVAHVDGAELRAVTSSGEVTTIAAGTPAMQAPEVAPDGTIVVVVDDRPPRAGRSLDVSAIDDELAIVRLAADGTRIEELAVVSAGSVAFDLDPTGRRLAVWESDLRRPGAIQVVDLDGGAIDVVLDEGGLGAAWSPNGEVLAILLADGDGTASWAFWDGDLVEAPPFRPTGSFVRDYLPFWDQYLRAATPWAPDGSAIVHTGLVDGMPTVLVQPVDGSAPRPTVGGDMAWWSPVGRVGDPVAP